MPHFFFLVNIKRSRANLHEKAKQVNERFRETGIVKSLKGFLQPCHLTTAEQLLHLFVERAKSQANVQVPHAPFKTNYVSIATYTNHKHPKNSKQHIEKLLKAEILIDPFELKREIYFLFSPGIIEFLPNQRFQNWLRGSIAKEGMSNSQLNELEKFIRDFKFITEFFPFAQLETSCPDFILLIEKNIMNSNIDHNLVNIGLFEKNGPEHRSMGAGDHGIERNTAPTPRLLLSFENNYSAAAAVGQVDQRLEEYTFRAWQIALAAFGEKQWNTPVRKFLSPERISIAKSHIRQWFSMKKRNGVDYQIAIEEFFERIVLAERYISKNESRFIPPPDTYFDPRNKNGFAGTEDWLYKTNQQRARNSTYYSHMKLLVKHYTLFSKEPTVFNFTAAIKALEGKVDDAFLELFYKAVTGETHFSADNLYELYQKLVLREKP